MNALLASIQNFLRALQRRAEKRRRRRAAIQTPFD